MMIPLTTTDGCPACGTDVRAIWTRSSGGADADTQGNACPTCGALLRRDVGDVWHVETPARASEEIER
jgi:endogenous inhibitor of DNA gyrase (YacG/DUF329 family)